MRSVFITATDTGVGKTIVTAGVLSAARAAGLDAVPMKPTQTGCVCRDGRWSAPDLDLCYSLSGYEPAPVELALACPYPFQPACSPHLAAAMAGRRVSIPGIVYRFRRLRAAHDAVLVEGAGGVQVPLNEKQTMLDLMRALKLPVILVTRTSLGTLNHTLLSVESLRAAGLNLLGIVAVHHSPHPPGIVEDNNLQTLEGVARVPVLARIPYFGELAQECMAPSQFKKTVAPLFTPVLRTLGG